jgi:hypothetical protein
MQLDDKKDQVVFSTREPKTLALGMAKSPA